MFTKGLPIRKVKHNISTVRYDKIVYVRSLRHREKGVNRMSNRVKNVSYMYRNTLGKFVTTKSNSKRIEDAVRRCEDIMIYMDVNAERKMLAMPKIGAGLDKMPWKVVLSIIIEVFNDEDITILVCDNSHQRELREKVRDFAEEVTAESDR